VSIAERLRRMAQAPPPGMSGSAREGAAGSRDLAREQTPDSGAAAREQAEDLAAAVDLLLRRSDTAGSLAQRIRDSLPEGPIGPLWARLIAPVLVGIAAPPSWSLLREEFRTAVLEMAGPDRGDPSPHPLPILPILVAARDEAIALPQTLRKAATAIRNFRARRPDIEVELHLCDNASRDATRDVLAALRDEIQRAGIPVHLHHEPEPGKERALKRMLDPLTTAERRPEQIVFADADIDWHPEVLIALWDYLDRFPEIEFAGARIVPRRGSLPRGNVWGVLDTVPFLGFGGSGRHGRGRHFRFVSGMTYMGRTSAVARIHGRIPLTILNEDVALSFLAGPERVAIARDAIVEYRIAQSRREFQAIKARHVRGCMQVLEWAAALAAGRALAADLERRGRVALVPGTWDGSVRSLLRKARRAERGSVRRVVEMGAIPMARSVVLERHETPIQLRDGSIDLRRRVAVFSSPTHLLAISTLMLPFYTAFKLAARWRLGRAPGRAGWTPVRGDDPDLPSAPDHGADFRLD
jgi:hypothetical protein